MEENENQPVMLTEEKGLFAIEEICGARIQNGKKEYYIKWKLYARSPMSWELAENIYAPDLVAAYYKAEEEREEWRKWREKEDEERRKRWAAFQNKGQKKQKARKTFPVSRRDSGFRRGLEAEKILGARESNGEKVFLMKWKPGGEEYANWVSSSHAKIICPQVVIAFYQKNLPFPKDKKEKEKKKKEKKEKEKEKQEEETEMETETETEEEKKEKKKEEGVEKEEGENKEKERAKEEETEEKKEKDEEKTMEEEEETDL